MEPGSKINLKIAVSAGEYSGDQHAARLISGIKAILPRKLPKATLELKGMGGRCLKEQGLEQIVDSETSGSINGFNLYKILTKSLGIFIRMARLLSSWRPDLLIVVDYPDFNLRLARVAKFLGIPVFYYIPPKVWAWRSGRVQKIKKSVERTGLIFPFETEFFAEHGYDRGTYVGHPFADEFSPANLKPISRETYLKQVGLDPAHKVVTVFPGSRQSEVERHLHLTVEALQELRKTQPDVQALFILAPAVDIEKLKNAIPDESWFAVSRGTALEALRVADCGLLKSGTCNLEAAFFGLPFVCFYTGSHLMALIVRLFVKIKEYSLVNIVLPGTVKELIQKAANPKNISQELEKLLTDKAYIAQQKTALKKVTALLSAHDSAPEFTGTNSTTERAAALALATARRTMSGLGLYKRLFAYLKPYKGVFAVALICMVIFGASDGVLPFLIKYMLDDVFAAQDKMMLSFLPVLIVVFSILRAVVDFGQEYLTSKIGHNIIRDIRNDVNAHLLKMSGSFYLRHSAGNLLARFTSDVLMIRTLLTSSLVSVVRDLIRVVALLATAVYLDPVLAAIAFIAFPIGLIPILRFGRRMRRLSKKGQDAIGTLSSLLQETIIGNRVVKIFGREEYEQQRFMEENQRLNSTFVKSERVRSLTGPVNEILASLAIAGVLLYGGFSVIRGDRSQGDFIAFLVSVFLLYDPFKKLSRIHSVVQQGLSGAERIFEILDEQSDIREPLEPKKLGKSNTLEIQNVSFSYKENDEWVLHNIQLNIPEGKKFALVGHSGSGKSTLADLIPRFIDPQKGCVKIGGVDIAHVTLAELRSRITMVSQHTFLFNDTIFNNIAYGRPGASRAEVIEAARAAYAYDFVMELPLGFDSLVGQDGLSLSGGERQRISIARAILKDAPILIMDEATASLDNRSEREVQAALKRLEQNRTTLVIAHRLSTIHDADCIVVMDQGRAIEAGTHHELLSQGGLYSALYEMQFKQTADAGEPLLN